MKNRIIILFALACAFCGNIRAEEKLNAPFIVADDFCGEGGVFTRAQV